jgi:hypothetical protein
MGLRAGLVLPDSGIDLLVTGVQPTVQGPPFGKTKYTETSKNSFF